MAQEQVAEFLGIGRSAYSNYEDGRREPPIDVLEKFANIMGCDLATIYEENEEGTFDRFEEEHMQHAFTVDEVKAAIKESGLELLQVLDVSTMEAPTEDSDRLYFIAREVTK